MVPIEIKNLTKVYSNDVVAVKDFNLKVKKSETFGFIGPNGAGKTTLIKAVLGLIKPTKGSTFINGKDSFIVDPDSRLSVGYLPAEVSFDKSMKNKEILELTKKIKNCPDYDYSELVKEFELPLDMRFAELSTGNKKKLGLINALIGNPEILIMDEPTTGLDPLMQKKFIEVIGRVKKEGTTIFLSSHILTEVQELSDRIGIIRKGELVALEDLNTFTKFKYKLVKFESDNFKIDKRKSVFKNISSYKNINDQHEFHYEGDVQALIKEISKFNIKDIEIKNMDIESIFISFYN